MSTYFAFAIGFAMATGIFGYLFHWLRKKANMLIYDLQDVIVCNNIVETNLKQELRMARDAAQGKKLISHVEEVDYTLSPERKAELAERFRKAMVEMRSDNLVVIPEPACPHIPITKIDASSVPYSQEFGIYQSEDARWFVRGTFVDEDPLSKIHGGPVRKTRTMTLIRSE